MKYAIRPLVIAACAALILAVATAPAGAGQFNVSPDIGSGYAWNANGWAWGLSGFNFNINSGTIESGGHTIGNPGTYMWARTPRLPATVNMDSLFYNATYSTQTGQNPFAIRLCYYDSFNFTTGGGACAGDAYGLLAGTNATTKSISGGLACASTNAGDHTHHCGMVQLEVTGSFNRGHISFAAPLFTLSDYTPPAQDTSYGGNQLRGGGWLRGNVTGAVHVTDDRGSGIKSSGLTVEGSPVDSRNFSCDYANWIPCPQDATWYPALSTTTLTDGHHLASLGSTDAGNMSTVDSNFAIKVDNTKPEPPEEIAPRGNGINGWSTTNDFGASWTNGAETNQTATQSGLAKVIVDVNPSGSGGQSDPAPVTVPIGGSAGGISATLDSVSGVQVPAQGRWTLSLALVDRAGNVSAVGDGSPVDPDNPNGPKNPNSQVTIGYDTSYAGRPAGHANGWASREELANSKVVQRWDAPAFSDTESPVCGWGLAVDQSPTSAGPATINATSPSWVVPNAPGVVVEGENWVHIRAVKCTGLPSAETEHMRLMADFTDPDAGYSGVESGKWYRAGRQVVLRGVDHESGMAPAAPDVADSQRGAYISYLVNGEGPADKDAPRGGEVTIPMRREGPKTLAFSPVDEAGNRAKQTKVAFGIDATPPNGHLDAQDPARPTLISAPLTDGLSGVATAVIAVRSTAGGDWLALPTALSDPSGGVAIGGASTSGVATARFPDTKLPRGTYEARARAFDQAGNELSTNKDKNGGVHTVSNPMRSGAGLSSAIYQGLHKCRRRRGSKCIKKVRGRVLLVGGKSSVEVGFRRAGVVQGYLTRSDYTALGRQPLEIHTKAQGESEVLAATISTGSDGSFHYRLRPGISRDVRIHFPGSELIESSEAHVRFATRGRIKLRVNRPKIASGQTLRFTGRVHSYNKQLPPRGKLIVLQFYSKNKWRPAVTIARTDARGNFNVSYKFDRSSRATRARIKFRVIAPSELDWPHASTTSRAQVVKLNWR
jgi:hypothetical protein